MSSSEAPLQSTDPYVGISTQKCFEVFLSFSLVYSELDCKAFHCPHCLHFLLSPLSFLCERQPKPELILNSFPLWIPQYQTFCERKKKKKSKLTFSSWTRSSPLAWISILITAVFSSSAKINAHENQDPEYQIYWLWWAANHPGPCKTPLTPSPMIQAI